MLRESEAVIALYVPDPVMVALAPSVTSELAPVRDIQASFPAEMVSKDPVALIVALPPAVNDSYQPDAVMEALLPRLTTAWAPVRDIQASFAAVMES